MDPKLLCPVCNGGDFRHLHDAAYGLDGTHISGSERFVCKNCRRPIYKVEGEKLGFKFALD